MNGIEIENIRNKTSWGVILDSNFKFGPHIKYLCGNATLKLSALSRINKYLSFNQKLLLVNSFVKSQFTYCPLSWMFFSTTLNNSLNNIHERALCLVHNNYDSSFYDILEMSNEKTIHKIFRFLEQFSLVISNFSQNFQSFFCNFSSQISFFSTPASTIAAVVPAIMSKDSQINLFCSSFWSNVLTRFFYH